MIEKSQEIQLPNLFNELMLVTKHIHELTVIGA